MINETTKQYYKSVRKITNGTYNKTIGMYLGEQNNTSCKENRTFRHRLETKQFGGTS